MEEDLTASHWDDVLSPSANPFANSSTIGGYSGGFEDPHKDDHEDDHDLQHEQEQHQTHTKSYNQMFEDVLGNGTSNYMGNAALKSQFNDFGLDDRGFNEYNPETEQLSEMAKEERKDHSSNLISELTHGVEIEEVIAPLSPAPKSTSGALFKNITSPIKVVPGGSGKAGSSTNTPLGKSKLFARSRRYTSKTVVENLEADTGASNPLGPLGGESLLGEGTEQVWTERDQLVKEADAPLYHIPKEAKQELSKPVIPRPKPAVVSATGTAGAVESTASFRNGLQITVGDPMKVGDITTAHIIYNVFVKNKAKKPDLTAEAAGSQPAQATVFPEEPVSRRYRDFRWLYHQLQNNHPGIIIPPPPTKQTYIGRFNESFIENRRLSLEKMLTKISNLPSLCNDADFMMFLTSNDFANELKERERIVEGGDDELSSFGVDINSSILLDNELLSGSTGGGLLNSFFSISNKIPEPNDSIKDKKLYIENLESNLKNFYKSIEVIGIQRNEIIGLVEEISILTEELSSLEILKKTTDLLGEFSDIHAKLKENLDRTNLQDQLTLGFTIEEYLRIIDSIKSVFNIRLKIYSKFQNCEQELLKKQSQYDKFIKKYKSQHEKTSLLKFEIEKLELKTLKFKNQFNTISETILNELERFEFEKIDDFRNSVEIFIENSIESQKESIELWETFYQRQNLSDI